MNIISIIIITTSVFLSIYDILKYKVPNLAVALLFILTLTTKIFRGTNVVIPLLYGLGAFSIFLLIHMVTKGKLGLGDAKYTGVIAFHFGFLFWLEHIIYSSLIALIVSLTIILRSSCYREKPIPFIPFLTIGLILNTLYPISKLIP